MNFVKNETLKCEFLDKLRIFAPVCCYKVPVPTLVLYHKNVDDTGIFSYQCLKSAAKQYSALVINSPLWQGGLNHSPTTFDLQLLLRAETEVTKIVIFLDGQRCTLWQNS